MNKSGCHRTGISFFLPSLDLGITRFCLRKSKGASSACLSVHIKPNPDDSFCSWWACCLPHGPSRWAALIFYNIFIRFFKNHTLSCTSPKTNLLLKTRLRINGLEQTTWLSWACRDSPEELVDGAGGGASGLPSLSRLLPEWSDPDRHLEDENNRQIRVDICKCNSSVWSYHLKDSRCSIISCTQMTNEPTLKTKREKRPMFLSSITPDKYVGIPVRSQQRCLKWSIASVAAGPEIFCLNI